MILSASSSARISEPDNQTVREIKSRYDLKDTKTSVELGTESITVNTDSEFTLDAIHSILQTKGRQAQFIIKNL